MRRANATPVPPATPTSSRSGPTRTNCKGFGGKSEKERKTPSATNGLPGGTLEKPEKAASCDSMNRFIADTRTRLNGSAGATRNGAVAAAAAAGETGVKSAEFMGHAHCSEGAAAHKIGEKADEIVHSAANTSADQIYENKSKILKRNAVRGDEYEYTVCDC